MKMTYDERTVHMRIGVTVAYALRRAQLDDIHIDVLNVKKPTVDADTGFTKVVVSHFYTREEGFKAKADAAFKTVEAFVRELFGESVKSVTLKSTSMRDRGGVDKTYSVVILVDREGAEAKALVSK